MAAVASVQATSIATTPSQGAPAQAIGDTGFLATLDSVIQALGAVSDTSAKVTNLAQTPATPVLAETAQTETETAGLVPSPAASANAPPATVLASASALASPSDPAKVSISAQSPVFNGATPPAAKAPSVASAIPDSSIAASVTPANAIAVGTPLASVSGLTPDTSPSLASDTDMLAVTLSQPVKYPVSSTSAPTSKVQVVQVAPVTVTQGDDSTIIAGATQTIDAGLDGKTILPEKTAAKTAGDKGTGQNDSSVVNAALPDPSSGLMLATVASQMQATANPQPQIQPQTSTETSIIAGVASQGLRQSPVPTSASANAPSGQPSQASLDVPAHDAIAEPHVVPMTQSVIAQPGTEAFVAEPKQVPTRQETVGDPGKAVLPAPNNPVAPVQASNEPAASSAAEIEGDQTLQQSDSLASLPVVDMPVDTKKAVDVSPAENGSSVHSVQPGDLLPTMQAEGQTLATDSVKAVHNAPAAISASPVEQISVVVQKGLAEGKTSMTIALDPADLGKVEVKLDINKDGSVQASILADNANTLTLLKNDGAGLHQALHNAGFSTDASSLNFSLRGENQNQGSAQAQQQQQSSRNSTAYRLEANVTDGNSSVSLPTGTQYALSTGNSRVDLFV